MAHTRHRRRRGRIAGRDGRGARVPDRRRRAGRVRPARRAVRPRREPVDVVGGRRRLHRDRVRRRRVRVVAVPIRAPRPRDGAGLAAPGLPAGAPAADAAGRVRTSRPPPPRPRARSRRAPAVVRGRDRRSAELPDRRTEPEDGVDRRHDRTARSAADGARSRACFRDRAHRRARGVVRHRRVCVQRPRVRAVGGRVRRVRRDVRVAGAFRGAAHTGRRRWDVATRRRVAVVGAPRRRPRGPVLPEPRGARERAAPHPRRPGRGAAGRPRQRPPLARIPPHGRRDGSCGRTGSCPAASSASNVSRG